MMRRRSTPEGMSEHARMVKVAANDLPGSAAAVGDDLRAAAERCGGRQIDVYMTDEDTASVTFWIDVHDDEQARATGDQVLEAVLDDCSYTVGVVHAWIG
jgi:hypothetical protein